MVKENQPIIFFGAAIQGTTATERATRATQNGLLIDSVKIHGFNVFSEHIRGRTREETRGIFESEHGKVPLDRQEASKFIRETLIKGLRGGIIAAVFDATIPSIGTGIEIQEALDRPLRNLPQIPILILNQKGYHEHGLSTMISGIDKKDYPYLSIEDYDNVDRAKSTIAQFLKKLTN